MAEHIAHRIPQQVNVCGIMNIGFNDKHTAPPQGLAMLFAHDRMAALHDQLVDLPKQLRGQQAHIIYQCLIVVTLLVPDITPMKLALSRVVVRQIMQPIKVAVQALLDHTQYIAVGNRLAPVPPHRSPHAR